MGFLQKFLPPEDRYAALLLYGMVFSTCFNGYDAGTQSARSSTLCKLLASNSSGGFT